AERPPTRPPGRTRHHRKSDSPTRKDNETHEMDNVLGLFDQTYFTGERVTSATGMLQCVWVYDREVDIDGLRRFHRNLQRGRLSRRIERSPLPFARYRWVSAIGQPDLEIVEKPRPRTEFDAWLSEQANTVAL